MLTSGVALTCMLLRTTLSCLSQQDNATIVDNMTVLQQVVPTCSGYFIAGRFECVPLALLIVAVVLVSMTPVVVVFLGVLCCLCCPHKTIQQQQLIQVDSSICAHCHKLCHTNKAFELTPDQCKLELSGAKVTYHEFVICRNCYRKTRYLKTMFFCSIVSILVFLPWLMIAIFAVKDIWGYVVLYVGLAIFHFAYLLLVLVIRLQ